MHFTNARDVGIEILCVPHFVFIELAIKPYPFL